MVASALGSSFPMSQLSVEERKDFFRALREVRLKRNKYFAELSAGAHLAAEEVHAADSALVFAQDRLDFAEEQLEQQLASSGGLHHGERNQQLPGGDAAAWSRRHALKEELSRRGETGASTAARLQVLRSLCSFISRDSRVGGCGFTATASLDTLLQKLGEDVLQAGGAEKLATRAAPTHEIWSLLMLAPQTQESDSLVTCKQQHPYLLSSLCDAQAHETPKDVLEKENVIETHALQDLAEVHRGRDGVDKPERQTGSRREDKEEVRLKLSVENLADVNERLRTELTEELKAKEALESLPTVSTTESRSTLENAGALQSETWQVGSEANGDQEEKTAGIASEAGATLAHIASELRQELADAYDALAGYGDPASLSAEAEVWRRRCQMAEAEQASLRRGSETSAQQREADHELISRLARQRREMAELKERIMKEELRSGLLKSGEETHKRSWHGRAGTMGAR
eukprot:TRINITY_DN57285_c0_g1_i1.p1 TRINITY_DN57285_c0_g1~~TRINITY_DN57285_c0_g1_i1.p1  ORF type:complete len:507 (+),score=105.27 TRINITY_DN57285_c0_g1_i1:139-1521(+)